MPSQSAVTTPVDDRVRLTIRVEEEFRRKIKIMALQRGETVQDFATRALLTEYEHCEDEYRQDKAG